MENRADKPKRRRKAGHRSWAAHGGPVAGGHQGDFMSREMRSQVMSRIKSKDTTPERTVVAILSELGLSFEQHSADLPGRPDVVFRHSKLAIFIDGDFWHGWRFPLWEHKLNEKWRKKIDATRRRDQRNFSQLRQKGWKVIRVWEHQIESDPVKCVTRILAARESRLTGDL